LPAAASQRPALLAPRRLRDLGSSGRPGRAWGMRAVASRALAAPLRPTAGAAALRQPARIAVPAAWRGSLAVPCGARAPRRFCTFSVTFVKDGSETVVEAKNGQSILELAHEHDLDIEGACGGECACSTCHVVLEQASFDAMPEPDEDEVDMLDLAANVVVPPAAGVPVGRLPRDSRLGCCVKLQKGRDDNIRIQIPEGAVNLLA
ncbi:unnamed protein product, partial [Prorocentrum cordatum]